MKLYCIELYRNFVLSKFRLLIIKNFKLKIMQIKPLSDHILIEPIKGEEKTKSGILLPETAEKEKPEQGIVIAIGDGKGV